MASDSLKPEDIFSCKKCGECCRGYGGTYITQADIQAISAFIHADPERFVSEYCRDSGGRPVIAQAENGFCVFWDKVCSIHPVKPGMCRAWPFIEAVLVDAGNWYAMADSCPGMRTDVSETVILECVKAVIGDR